MSDLILAINPGAGSTKVGLYRDGASVEEHAERHAAEALSRCARIADQLPLRAEMVRAFLARAKIVRGELSAVVGRGGLLRPIESGTYLVDTALLGDATRAERGEHAANLGAILAGAIADEQGCPAYVVDPVSVDELEPVARYSGLAGVERTSLCHALNIRAVARRHAASLNRPLEELGLVVAHLGTGVSLSAHRGGRMVDVVNPIDEGPFAGDRTGGIPSSALIEMCFSPGADARTVKKRLFGDGGLYSYLGTRDVREASERAEQGDREARAVLDAMGYQVAKAVGEMAVVLRGRVDAVLLTGGAAHVKALVDAIEPRVAWIAPVVLYPGEDELLALAEGARRVVTGEERPKRYG